jgi:hypothetical protein
MRAVAVLPQTRVVFVVQGPITPSTANESLDPLAESDDDDLRPPFQHQKPSRWAWSHYRKRRLLRCDSVARAA